MGVAGPQGVAGQSAPQGGIAGQLSHCAPNANYSGYLVYIPGRAFSVFTGADGSFQIDNVPAGTYTLAVEGPSVSASVPDIAVADALVTLDPISIGTCAPACVPSAEVCDGLDNDCDGVADNGVGLQWFRDADADGFGTSMQTTLACAQPPGFVAVGGDCNDANHTVHPGAAEVCDGIDNNCDGAIDNGASCPVFPNANGACSAGACGIGACDAGFANCDNNSNNGCEIRTVTDPDNCGGCGLRCSFPNAFGACNGGSCMLAGCNTGFNNCDGIISNGCETSGACAVNNFSEWKQWQRD